MYNTFINTYIYIYIYMYINMCINIVNIQYIHIHKKNLCIFGQFEKHTEIVKPIFFLH